MLPLTFAIGMYVVDGSWDDGIAERLRAWNQHKARGLRWPGSSSFGIRVAGRRHGRPDILTSQAHIPSFLLLFLHGPQLKLHTLHDILYLDGTNLQYERLRTWRVRPSRNADSQAYRPEGLPRFSEPYREYGCWPFLGVRYGYIGPA